MHPTDGSAVLQGDGESWGHSKPFSGSGMHTQPFPALKPPYKLRSDEKTEVQLLVQQVWNAECPRYAGAQQTGAALGWDEIPSPQPAPRSLNKNWELWGLV